MSFIFSQVNGSSIGQSAPDIGAGTFFGTAFDQGFRYSMLNSIYRMSEYRLTQDEDPFWNPRLKKEDANHFAQQQGVDLKFDDDPTQDEVNLLIRRHIEERDRAAILSAGATGIGRSAGQIGVQFLGSVLNPLDLPFMFLPIVGTATKAKNAGAFSNTVRRGIITREALEANGIALRGYTAAMIEGSVGQAITEIPLMFANMQDQTDYTAKMFFTNVALGAAFGAGVKTIQKVFQAVGRAHTRLTPETRENMGTGAMDDFIRGEPIDPARFVELDNGVIGSRASQSMDQLGYPVANNLDRQVDVTQHTANLKRMAEGSESVVYRDGKSVVKVSEEYSDKSQASYEKRVSDALERDEILGDGTMELDGYYLSPNGTKNPIFRQDFVEGRPATREEIQAHMESKGFTIDKAGKTTDTFIKVEDGQTYKVGDLDGDNVIVDKDGVAHIIDGDLVVTPKDPVDPEVIKEKRIEEERKAVEAFKAREEARAKHKEAELQREIDEVVPTPKAERAEFGEIPTEVDLKRIEAEIKDLEDRLSAAADEWEANMDRLEGNMGDRKPEAKLAADRSRKFERDMFYSTWKAHLPKATNGELASLKADDIANAIQAMNIDRRLIDELFELDPELRELKVEFDPKLLKDKGAVGMYNGYEDKIYLNAEVSPKTFFHELVHSTVVRKMRQEMANTYQPALPILRGKTYLEQLSLYGNKSKKNGIKGLVDAYVKAVDYHVKNVPDSNILSFINSDARGYYLGVTEPHYGLLNIDEFIAEAVSNRQFQFYLNTIPGTGNKTLFTEFIDKLKEFFGLADKKGSLLDEVLTDYKKLVMDGSRAPDDFLKNVRKVDSKDVTTPMIERASTCILYGQA